MGYGDSCSEGYGFVGGFALLVVLFILLIIIRCSYF
ncbi:TPA: YjcZ family sporulation protein [Bacillus cereus]|nr:YjcZ family sporulation protein [Bacillus cereus]